MARALGIGEAEEKIQDALAVLLECNRMDDVSVSSICREAGVSRDTFYRHFKDKYDVAGSVILRDLGRTIGYVGTTDDVLQASCTNLFQTIAANRSFYVRACRTREMTTSLRHYTMEFCNALVGRMKERCPDPSPELATYLHYLPSIVAGVMEQWILEGMETPPDEMAALHVRRLFPPEYLSAEKPPVGEDDVCPCSYLENPIA